jgi:hypothetical protein
MLLLILSILGATTTISAEYNAIAIRDTAKTPEDIELIPFVMIGPSSVVHVTITVDFVTNNLPKSGTVTSVTSEDHVVRTSTTTAHSDVALCYDGRRGVKVPCSEIHADAPAGVTMRLNGASENCAAIVLSALLVAVLILLAL